MNIFNRHYLHYRTLDRDIKNEVKNRCRMGYLVMDAGCGAGRYKHLFEEDFYLGCDTRPIGYRTHRYDLCKTSDLPKEWTSAFDFVLCAQVLEHVPHFESAVDSLVKMTKPGGIIVITVPFMWGIHGEPHDYRRIGKYELMRLEDKGLSVVNLKPQTKAFATLVQLFINYTTSAPAPIRWMAKAAVPVLNIVGVAGDWFSSDQMTLNYMVVYKKL